VRQERLTSRRHSTVPSFRPFPRSARYLPTESSLELRAAAESEASRAPRTPRAPGSLEAPSTLSRSRSLAGRLGLSLFGPQARDARIRTSGSRGKLGGMDSSGLGGEGCLNLSFRLLQMARVSEPRHSRYGTTGHTFSPTVPQAEFWLNDLATSVSSCSRVPARCEYSLSEVLSKAVRFVYRAEVELAPKSLLGKMLQNRYYYFSRPWIASSQCLCTR
jgi:hypothetical protein